MRRSLRGLGSLACLPLVLLAGILAGCGGEDIVEVIGPGLVPSLDVDERLVAELPVTAGCELYAVHLDPSGEAWAAGSSGLILHHQDGLWSREESGTRASLAGLARAGDGTLIAVGAGGIVLRRAAARWVAESAPTNAALLAAVAADDGSVWAAGAGGTLLRREGGTWRTMATPIDRELRCLAARGEMLLTGGIMGTVLLRSGGVWTDLSGLDSSLVEGVGVTGTGRILALADQTLWEWRDGSWQALKFLVEGSGLGVVGETVYCGGVLRLDCSQEPPLVSGGWHHRFGDRFAFAGPDRILVAGFDGRMAWYDSGEDDWHRDPQTLRWFAFHPLLDGTVLARNGLTLLAHVDGAWRGWLELPEPEGWYQFVSFSGRSSTDLYVVHRQYDMSVSEHVLRHHDGVSWRRLGLPETEDPLNRAFAMPAGDVVICCGSRVHRGDGTTWEEIAGLPSSAGCGMWQTRNGQIFARPYDAGGSWADSLYWYDGDAFRHIHSFDDEQLEFRRLAGTYPGELYLLGAHGYILLDGAGGEDPEVAIPYEEGASYPFLQYVAEGENSIYLAFSSRLDCVYRLERGRPAGPATFLAGPLGSDIYELAVAADGALLIEDDHGILHRLPPESF